MALLIIKVSLNGSSREYLFNRPGPILIGSEQGCDICLEDPQIEANKLAVKLSGGEIYVKEIGTQGQIYLNSIILPKSEDILYQEGETIALENTNYQIHIACASEEEHVPPPFFESEFKERLERASLKVKEREKELKELDEQQEKRRAQLLEIGEQYSTHSGEKGRLVAEIETLKSVKEGVIQEIKHHEKKGNEVEQRVLQNKQLLHCLEDEERALKEAILSHNTSLIRLKDESELKRKELENQQMLLAERHLNATQIEGHLQELVLERTEHEREILGEKEKIEKILASSDAVLKEKARYQQHLVQLLKDKTVIQLEISQEQELLAKLGSTHKETEHRLNTLRAGIGREEGLYQKLQERIQLKAQEEAHLQRQTGDLCGEVQRLEEKLTTKKGQINQLEFQGQEAAHRLSVLNFEVERTAARLKELGGEEKAQEFKIISLRTEQASSFKKSSEEQKKLNNAFEEQKRLLELELQNIRHLIVAQQQDASELEAHKAQVLLQIEDLRSQNFVLSQEKKALESQVVELEAVRTRTAERVNELKQDAIRLLQEKSTVERELDHLKNKVKTTETELQEMKHETHLFIETTKAQERAKMMAEKDVLMMEIEAYKQKSKIEVEADYRRKEEELHSLKQMAQNEAEVILGEARSIEDKMGLEVSRRLKQATDEANERETQAHQRVKEAQDYLRRKEEEADAIIQKARLEAREFIKKSELELLEDLNRRKQKIKKFLTMKQEGGLKHLKAQQVRHESRLIKAESHLLQKFEQIKRKELKKVAHLREEELSQHKDIKDKLLKEIKLEKEKTFLHIQEMKRQQEAELAQTRKSVLDHINQTKFYQEQAWEEQLQREKSVFERSKKDRIANATQAVMNVLLVEIGPHGDNEKRVKEKIACTLEMAIDGQKAGALMEMEQVLDFNPQKRKQALSVLKKWSLRFGVPAAVALVLLTDMGQVRTRLVDHSKEFIRQKQSASDIFVKQQHAERKEKYTFAPSTTPGLKASFTENILYTTDYEKVMEDEQFQNEWILSVHDFMVKELELSEELAISYISAEGTLFKEIAAARKEVNAQFLDQGIKKLRDLEKVHLGWLDEKIQAPESMQKFKNFRKEIFDRFYQENYLARRPASGEKEQEKVP